MEFLVKVNVSGLRKEKILIETCPTKGKAVQFWLDDDKILFSWIVNCMILDATL